ncbi:MAG: MalY/PatB family protein [Bacteroidales bacterium]
MQQINRYGSYSIKVDALNKYYGKENLLPLWVADMDFETPACVRNALQEIIDKKVYGYNFIPDNYFSTISGWLLAQQEWRVEQKWLSFIPGIVKGIGYAVNFFTKEGDGIIVQPPVYPPFINVPKGNNRRIIFNPLIKEECGYRMDFDNLEQILLSGESKMLILCNPHNPGGVAWDRETLVKLAQLCYKYNILVVSDEIHADMPLYGGKHLPFALVSKEANNISITFGAPSKTFNMAGIVSSYAIVPNEKLREPFYNWMQVNELNSPTIFATLSTIAAYTNGLPWRNEMLEYIGENVNFVEQFCKENFGKLIIPMRPKSSFLVWLDCTELCKKLAVKYDNKDITDEEKQKLLVDLFINRAGLALNDGAAFGPGGLGFMRLNVGCGREVLVQALNNLKNSII